jgi:hypothetical protein
LHKNITTNRKESTSDTDEVNGSNNTTKGPKHTKNQSTLGSDFFGTFDENNILNGTDEGLDTNEGLDTINEGNERSKSGSSLYEDNNLDPYETTKGNDELPQTLQRR